MLGDLKSKKLIVFKGALFGVCLLLSAVALVLQTPRLHTGLLVALLAWSSARFYYFLFYVLQNYVDPSLKYDGLWAMAKLLVRKGQSVASPPEGEVKKPE